MNTTKARNAVGIALAIALSLLTLSGSGYFFFTLKVSFVQWLAFNACSPTSLIYLVCLSIFWLKGKTGLLPFALLPMYYFGTMGLFTFTWSGANVFAQLSHITMTLNIAWATYTLYRIGDYKATAKGLFWGIVVFVPYVSFVMYYCRTHAAEIGRLLQMAG